MKKTITILTLVVFMFGFGVSKASAQVIDPSILAVITQQMTLIQSILDKLSTYDDTDRHHEARIDELEDVVTDVVDTLQDQGEDIEDLKPVVIKREEPEETTSYGSMFHESGPGFPKAQP